MERINYIDSLKGIAIITIVWRHIADLGLIGHVNCLFLSVLNSFHVPLFFFLSGIFAFKRLETITTKNIFLFVKDKFFRLLFPFTIFGGLYHFTVCNLNDFPGYWFLPALFYCMLIGIVYKTIENVMGGGKIKDVVLIVFVWGIASILWMVKLDIPYYLGGLKQFPFFMMGYYFNKYEILTLKKLNKEHFMLPLLICFSVSFYVMYSRKMIFNFPALFAVPIVVCFVSSISKTIPSWINGVGKHSLEIYVLHFFFIPSIFPVGSFLLSQHSYNENFIIVLLICAIISIPIIAICLILSKIIGMSKYLGLICFGKKIKK